MKEALLDFFRNYPHLALIGSLVISILIAVIGILPSVFITAANLLFFGFWKGLTISFAGEALGAVVAFYLYRKGFKKGATEHLKKYRTVNELLLAEKMRAFWLIFSLRLIPFVPSGLVTFAAAIGRVSAITFLMASSIGKLPALFMEAYAVYEVSQFGWQGKVILTVTALVILYFILKQILTRKKNTG